MVTMKVKSLFFDSPKVKRAVSKAKRREQSRAGAFIRTRAKSSIRTRKGYAPPGQPPHSHAGHLKRLIYFSYDPATGSVVVGPLRWAKGEAPSLLEHSGRAIRTQRRGRRRVRRRVFDRARPFLGPALLAELPNIPRRWRNAIRRN